MNTEISKNDFTPKIRAVLYVVVFIVLLVALFFKVITFDNLRDLLEMAVLALGLGSSVLATRNIGE